MEDSSSTQTREGRSDSMEDPPEGDSSSPPCEELCSVCLDVLTDPVTTPCGHTFCKTCLTNEWDSSQVCHCPLCEEELTEEPELSINTTQTEAEDQFKTESDLNEPEILCDVCTGKKVKALKSCVDCGVSFCEAHLESHTTAKLKKHKLIDPVKKLDDYICLKHERPLLLFCIDDQTAVCQFCTETEHKNHCTIPVEEESGERKMSNTQTKVQQMIQNRMKKIEEIKFSVGLRKKNTEKEIADSVELLGGLMRSIERSQAELLDLLEEKQKTAEMTAEGFVEELEQEIAELNKRDNDLEKVLHTEDHLRLIEISSSLCSPLNYKSWTDIHIDSHLCLNPLRKALSQLKKSLNESLSESELKKIQQYAVDVTLDPDTAHSKLILSDDGKQVVFGDRNPRLPDNPRRFTCYIMVLGKEGFSSGKFYYEVQVKGKAEWNLGVAQANINRKGVITLSPKNGFWTIILTNGIEYRAGTGTFIPLPLRNRPQIVGVFVDYEEGLVSFYDVGAKSLIYSFTGQSFTEELYPYFCPGISDKNKNSAPLIISPMPKNE
ncbi:E3 ubiquitin-protein ligase TRIM39-like isoform X2 [Hoplias malabaricus]|uniref:E3 ubiquitin-protein ligase TRIM39-like isoform X2 n=1 Tax=Hoplias malabaricus TaxID=27720 RepID=UPI003461A664